MGLKVTKSLTIKTLLPSLKKEFLSRGNQQELKNLVRNTIESGKSPVQGKTFKKYSKGYARIKGRTRPVDMKRSGKMLNSLQVSLTSSSIVLRFRNKKPADYHNRLGAGRGKVVRRLLPSNRGERFKKSIENTIVRYLRRAARIAARKQR